MPGPRIALYTAVLSRVLENVRYHLEMMTSNAIGERKSWLSLLEIVKLAAIYAKALKRGCGIVNDTHDNQINFHDSRSYPKPGEVPQLELLPRKKNSCVF